MRLGIMIHLKRGTFEMPQRRLTFLRLSVLNDVVTDQVINAHVSSNFI